MSVVSFALAVVFIIRLFSTSAFRVPMLPCYFCTVKTNGGTVRAQASQPAFAVKGPDTSSHCMKPRGENDGAMGAQLPWRQITTGAPNHCGDAELVRKASKSPNDVTSTYFDRVILLQKELRFDHGGTELAFFPGRHLISLRP